MDPAVVLGHEPFVAAFESFPKLKEVPRPNLIQSSHLQLKSKVLQVHNFPGRSHVLYIYASARGLGGNDLLGRSQRKGFFEEKNYY